MEMKDDFNFSAMLAIAHSRSPLLGIGVCTTVRVSYARLRIGVVSQPFCVDQLNSAGFN